MLDTENNIPANNTIQALWVGIGSLSSFALSIVSAAILSRYFDKIEYGTYKQIIYIYSSLLVIFSAGLPNVFAYFLPRYNINQGKEIVWKLTKLLLIAGFIFSLFIFIFSNLIANLLRNPELGIGLKYFSPIPMLLLPTLGIEGIFSTYKKTIFIAIYNTITRLLMLIFIVLPVILLKGTYLYAIFGWIIVSVLSLFLANYFKGIPFKNIQAEKTDLTLKKIFKYSIPLVTASIAGIAIKSADQFYISRYFGAEIFADFSNGFIELPFVSMITTATSIVLMPIFSKIIHDKSQISYLINMWQNALNKSAIIIYPLVIYFIWYAKNVILLLYSAKYMNSVIFFQIAMSTNFFNIIIFAPLIFSLGKTEFYAKVHIFIAIFIWTFSYLLIILFHSPIVIAIFSVVISILKIFIFLKYVSKLISVKFFILFPITKLLKLVFHSSISLLIINISINYLYKDLTNLSELTLSFMTYIAILILTSRIFRINYNFLYQPINELRK